MSDRIVLGHVTGVHGIKGEVVVMVHTADPEDLGAYGPLRDDRTGRNLIVEAIRITAKGAVVRLKGVRDRNTAEALRGAALSVSRTALPETAAGEFYHADLIGLTAVAPAGDVIGEVVAIQNYGAGDLLELRLVGQRHTELVPFRDAYVPTVDVAARQITVIMPEMVGDGADEEE